MDYERLSLNSLSEKQFMEDYEKGKRIVDSGISTYFILFNNSAMKDTVFPENTSLHDVIDVFGLDALELLRVAEDCNMNTERHDNEYVFSMRIRKIKKSDRAKLRHIIRFFPTDTFVCEWVDGNGNMMTIPFVQNRTTCEVVFLTSKAMYTTTGKAYEYEGTYPYHRTKEFINRIPDYFENHFAIVKYNGVDIVIPIKKGSAKRTFKNRDRENGVKRRLIHDVSAHGRKNLRSKNSVESHVRGTSEIKIRDLDVSLCATLSQAVLILKRAMKENPHAKNPPEC